MAKKIVLGTLTTLIGLTLVGGVVLPALIFLLPVVAVILINPITWVLLIGGGWLYFIYKLGQEKLEKQAKENAHTELKSKKSDLP